MADAPDQTEKAIRFLHGVPSDVEHGLELLADNYVATSIYFYVVLDHLEVAVTLVHQRELRRAQLAGAQIPPGLKMRPN